MSYFTPGQRVLWWLLLLAALAVTALIATDAASKVAENACPWEQDCATPASIERSGP